MTRLLRRRAGCGALVVVRRREWLERLAEAQNWRCCYCGAVMQIDLTHRERDDAATVEHVRPLSRGGLRRWENEVAACRACNQARGDCDAMAFFHIRQGDLAGGVELLAAPVLRSGVTLGERFPALAALAAPSDGEALGAPA